MATKLENVIIPNIDASARWDIEIANGKALSRTPSSCSACPGLLLPPLCHPHIHLDKPYILTSHRPPAGAQHPDYSDLVPKSGSFQEALANTSAAKTRYTPEDLYLRGSQLLAESCGSHGVTSMRVFVEVDHVVRFKTIEVGIQLKQDFEHLIRVQICVFAQDPIISGEHADENRRLMVEVLDRYSRHIEALGTTPYVEAAGLLDEAAVVKAKQDNISWAISTALERRLHLDFHLDYNLGDSSSVEILVSRLQQAGWKEKADPAKVIAVGHCTQLTTQRHSDLQHIALEIKNSQLPIHLVGLPTSDLFMMGRPGENSQAPHNRPRATLQVPSMIKDYGFEACIGVNNVGNAFTPYGDGDPLQLACWGTGIYQAGTPADAKLLYECVSDRARRAIGLLPPRGEGEKDIDVPVPGLLISNCENIVLPGKGEDEKLTIPARQRLSLHDVIWDPPNSKLRRVVR